MLLCGDPGTAKSQFLKYTLRKCPAEPSSPPARGPRPWASRHTSSGTPSARSGPWRLGPWSWRTEECVSSMNLTRWVPGPRADMWAEPSVGSAGASSERPRSGKNPAFARRADERPGQDQHPRGHGAAEHLHLEGRHRHLPAGPLHRHCCRQPHRCVGATARGGADPGPLLWDPRR